MKRMLIAAVLLLSAGLYAEDLSDNSNQIDTASDLVKTLTGFFVGAATGLLG